MGSRKRYKFSIRLKLVLLITVVALITYSTSGFFIYFVYDFVKQYIDQMSFTILTLALGIFWSGVLTAIAAGFIVTPLKRLEKAALQAADGDISVNVPEAKSDDEIKSLSRAFNDMLSSLRHMVQNIEMNFEKTNEQVKKIHAATEKATKQAESISYTIKEISTGADQSAASIQETAEAVENTVELAGRVKEKANISEKMSNDMVQLLDQSKKIFQSLIEGIQSLAEKNEQSILAVERLEENAKKVETIVSLVGDIADQTNLLALNASIEAARAGEHGRGFAVVAEEVRNLADESAKAVQGISELIHNIQAEVNNVVNQIEDQVKTARVEAQKGQETEKIFANMSESIVHVAEAVKVISELIDQQQKSIEQTGAQSEEVAAIAEETSAGAQEVAASVQDQAQNIANINQLTKDLEASAEQLKKTIDRFTYEI